MTNFEIRAAMIIDPDEPWCSDPDCDDCRRNAERRQAREDAAEQAAWDADIRSEPAAFAVFFASLPAFAQQAALDERAAWHRARLDALPESQAVTRRREYDAPIGSDDL